MILQHPPATDGQARLGVLGANFGQVQALRKHHRHHAAALDRRRQAPPQAAALALEMPTVARESFINLGAQPVCPPEPRAQPLGSELQWSTDFESRYILGKKLGTGSYGTCYIAIDRASGRACCVKVISKVRGNQPREKVLRKLATEVDYLTRVQECLGVVQLYETFEDAEKVYFVCELCSGGDLDSIIEKEGVLQEVAAARVMYEVLKVVATCHSHRVVHGDIKPANFVLKAQHFSPHAALHTGAGLQGAWLKAVDFGCSQAALPEHLTRRTGTPVFMAPEVYSRKYGVASDMWSCGIMMYQLMARRFPFWETYEECRSKSIEEVCTAVLVAPIPLQGAPWLKLSPKGMDFLSSLLERDVTERLTVQEALEHPWFQEQLGFRVEGQKKVNNILPLTAARDSRKAARQMAALR